MAQAFNLTAQLNLQAPGNVNQVVNQIRRQLKPIGIQVNIQNAKNIAQANSSLSSFNKNAQASTKSMNQLNRTLQESARRFSVITIATGSFLALANAFKNSVKEAVAFERELVKISQVTGKTVGQLGSLADEVTRLGVSLGASSSDLLNVARTLAQAGFAAEDTRQALDILAKTSLGATFNNIQDTTEGAIALLRQFKDEARAAGGDIKFLEQSLDAINAVSKAFAVESSDLISVIRRTGGVFSAAGGSINELIALFTSVRATTRESAETIATGLRTIFTRIQRPEAISQLREYGIELQDAEGNFVGAFEAFKRLSQGLKSIDPRTTTFSQIVEDLGGFRQVGKVIPLIQQFTTAQQALTVAQNASGSVAKDAETAQQSLGVQIQKVREQFDALIRKFVDSSAFRSLANGGIKLAEAFIRIADSLEPLLPMLITLAGLKLGKGLAPALGSFVGIGKSVSGAGPVTKFASGGMVPGSGNRDTVPAMLTPGEFVIRKASVKKLGASNLAAMNKNKYNAGGSVKKFNESAALTIPSDIEYAKGENVKFNLSKNRFDTEDEIQINRVPDIKVDVNKYKNRKSPAFNDYRNAVKNNDSKARGLAFERVVSEVNTGIKLAGALGEAQANEDSPTSRIDAFYNGVPREIKSKSKRLADKELGEKVVGGALRPRSDIDSGIQGLLTKQPLKKGKDTINLGSAGLIADVTDLTKINKEVTQKTTKLGRGVGEGDNEAVDLENKSRRGRPAGKFLGGLIQKFATGGVAEAQKKNAYIFDFDDTLATTEAKGFKDFNDPSFIKNALATRYAKLAKRRASQGDDIHVLTARYGSKGIIQAINQFMAENSITTKSVMAVGGAFKKEREPGKKPGTTRQLSTASKKAKVLSKLSGLYNQITFLDDNAENLLKASEVKGVSAVEAQESKLFKNKKNLGGFIQKFATGGIVQAKKAGAAILDPESASSKQVNITGEDIKKEFTEFKSLPKGKDPVSKYYKSSSFNIAKSGLNKETSNKFKMALEDGLVAGINTSTAALANDLGTSSAKIDQGQTSNFVKSINSSIFGRLFETTMDSISRSGQYAAPDTDPDRPFDAPGGLPASLKDNFSGLPDSFIDYKSSLAAASDANMKGKVIAQIKRELIQDGILNEKYPRKDFRDKERASSQAKSEKERQANEQAGRGFPARRATGGPAPSDNVPALLTPGEFVMSKSASQSIGYTNLNRMNKHGVQGYASGGIVGVQRYATGTGSLGATSAGPVSLNFADIDKMTGSISDKIIAATAKLGDSLDALGIDVEKQRPILQKFHDEMAKGGKVSDALAKSLKDSDINLKKTSESQKKLGQSAELAKNKLNSIQSGLEKARGIASAAQQFVFAGAMAASLAGEFSSAESSTKKAITQTVATFSTLIGIAGTIFELGLSVASTVIASKAFQAAMLKNAGATEINTQSKMGEAAGDLIPDGGGKKGRFGNFGKQLSSVKGPLIIFTAALVGAIGALTFFKNKAKALADEASKEFSEGIKSISEGESVDTSLLQKSLKEEMVQRETAANMFGATSAVIAGAGVAAGTALGIAAGGATASILATTAAAAALGSFVPVIGTAIGAVVGFGVAVGAAVIASAVVSEAARREAEARQQMIDTIMSNIETLVEMVSVANDVNKKLNEISKTSGLSEERTQELRLEQAQRLQGVSGGLPGLKAEADTKAIAAQVGLSAQEFESKSSDELFELFEEFDYSIDTATAAIKNFEVQTAVAAASEKNRAQLLDLSADIFANALQNADPTKSLEQLRAGDKEFADAYKLRADALKADAIISVVRAKRQLKEAKESGAEKDSIKFLEEQVNNANDSLANFDNLLREGAETSLAVRKAELDAIKLQEQAAIQMHQAMIDASKAVDIFNERLQAQKDEADRLSNFSRVSEGGLTDAQAVTVSSTEITPTFNIDKFEKETQAVINTLVDPLAIKEAEKVRDRTIEAAKSYQSLMGLIKETGRLNSDQDVANALGGQAEFDRLKNLLPEDTFEKILVQIKDASSTGDGITQEEMSDILDTLKQFGMEGSDIWKLITDANQQYLDNYTTYLGQVQKQYENELKYRQSVFAAQQESMDSELRLRNMLNQALDKEIELPDRRAKQARETAFAQQTLRNAGSSATAGDVNSLAAEKQRLEKERQQLGKQIEELKKADPGDGEAIKKQEKLLESQSKVQRSLEAVNDELGRLSDQSDAVNMLMQEFQNNVDTIKKEKKAREELIEVEKRARDQMYSVLEDFVVGGPEDRQQLGRAAMGVQYAYATGTLQNQSPEDRRATVGLLDQLSEVELMGGMTGKEIKQELVFRDAVQMGFPPEVAKQIATATSKEQQLIDEIKKLDEDLVDVNNKMLEQLREINAQREDAARANTPDGTAPQPPKDANDYNATGGLVQYRANGGSIFKPKGTDTVPAMLTPGEFVIRKSAVDKVGVGALQAINDGAGVVPGFARGGIIYRANGSDLPEYSPYYGTDLEKRYKEIDAEAAKAKASSQRSVDISKGNIKSTGVNESLVDKFSSFFGFASDSKEALKNRSDSFNSKRFGGLGLPEFQSPEQASDIRGAAIRGNKEVQNYENASNNINRVQRAIDDSGIAGTPFVGSAVNALQATAYGFRNTDGSLTDDVLNTARNVGLSRINVPGVGSAASGAVNKTAQIFGRGAGKIGNRTAMSFASQQATGDARGYILDQLNLAKGGVVYASDGIKVPYPEAEYDKKVKDAEERAMDSFMADQKKSKAPQQRYGGILTPVDILGDMIYGRQQPSHLDQGGNFTGLQDLVYGENYGLGRVQSVIETAKDTNFGTRMSSEQRKIFDQQTAEYENYKERKQQYEAGADGRANDYKKKMAEQSQLMQYAAAYDAEISKIDIDKQIESRQVPDTISAAGLQSALTLEESGVKEMRAKAAAADARRRAILDQDAAPSGLKPFGVKSSVPDMAETGDRMFDPADMQTELERQGKQAPGGVKSSIPDTTSTMPTDDEFSPGAMQARLQEQGKQAPGGVKSAVDFELGDTKFIRERKVADAKFKKQEEFSAYASSRIDELSEQIKNTFNPAARKPLEQEKAKLMFALQSGKLFTQEDFNKFSSRVDEERKLRGREDVRVGGSSSRTSPEKRKADQALEVAQEKTKIKRQEQIANLETSIANEKNTTKKAKMQKNLENLKFGYESGESFRGPLREGQQLGGGRDNVNTRRKARLAEQRRAVDPSLKTEDEKGRQSPEELQKRAQYERILRTQGQRAADRFAKTAGVNTAGSRTINSLASGYRRGGFGGQQMGGYGGGFGGGYGGGYGNQMVPFGFIPGSPYNSMLGRGGYNIPMFNKRMLFGNGAAFFANGGAAAGGDTVPAMLTPGEFVMNKGAVNKYGVGFMRSLNKGKIQGFNRGGMVQYKNDGDILRPNTGSFTGLSTGDGTGKIEGVFSGFVDNFSSVFDNIVAPFKGVTESIMGLADAFGNMVMNHTVNVEGMVNLGGLDIEAIKTELSNHIAQVVGDEVQRVTDQKANEYKS